MLFESRSFWHPKDTEFPGDYEDAFQVAEHGIVAIADGVSSAIFSRQWADILTRAVVETPPDLADGEAFQKWLADNRAAWRNSIDVARLSWMQRQKLQQVGGAYAALLWVELYPDAAVVAEQPASFRLRCFAVGDCCLFHIRNGELLRKFPLETVKDFDKDPITIPSFNNNCDHLLEFQALEDICQSGDLMILTTDALAKWMYQQLEAEQPVDWEEFWSISSEAWTERVAALRALPPDGRMRVDDTTLVMLRMTSLVGVTVEDERPASKAGESLACVPSETAEVPSIADMDVGQEAFMAEVGGDARDGDASDMTPITDFPPVDDAALDEQEESMKRAASIESQPPDDAPPDDTPEVEVSENVPDQRQ